MVNQLIQHLERNAKLADPIEVERFEATLGQIANLREPQSIPLLLPFFDDQCKYPETMFSIIHTIEMFEDTLYASQIVRALPTLTSKSPYWATVVHFRIFNHPPTRMAYRQELASADEKVQGAARSFLARMRTNEPEFADACDEMLSVLR